MQTTAKWQPTRQQVEFRSAAIQCGCVVTGEPFNVEWHHCVGASFRHNKVWIGQWFGLVLRVDLHRQMVGGNINVTDHKNEFAKCYGTEKELFIRQCQVIEGFQSMGFIKFDMASMPPPEVLTAIQDCRR